MNQTKITNEHLEAFKKICGSRHVVTDGLELSKYSHDETEHLRFLPEVVLKVRSAKEISEILKICNKIL